MKKIKSILFGMLAASILTIGFTSCSNDGCEDVTEVADNNKVHLANMIQEKLMIIMNDTTGEYKDGGYIVYSAKDNEMLLLSDFSYTLGDIFYRVTQGETCDTTIINDGVQPNKTPTGTGWKNGGTCSTKSGALRLAIKIANKIPSGSDFEIHAECNSNGTYTVWYRIIK